jgi:hypothetical protein
MQLGHIELEGRHAEERLSPAARKRRRIGWSQWAGEFNQVLARYEEYVWPDLIILRRSKAAISSRPASFDRRCLAPRMQARSSPR